MTRAAAARPCADLGGLAGGSLGRSGAAVFALRPAGRWSGQAPLSAGSIVRTGQNRHPHFEVIALAGDKAWIREVQSGADHVVPVARCRPVEGDEPHRPSHGR